MNDKHRHQWSSWSATRDNGSPVSKWELTRWCNCGAIEGKYIRKSVRKPETFDSVIGAMLQRPPVEEELLAFAVDYANKYIPKLGIPPEHQESALKAYVAGFFAGNGAKMGQATADRKSSKSN